MNSLYWVNRIAIDKEKMPALKFRENPCDDCAVVCGFYLEMSQSLKQEPYDIQMKVSEKWFCHNDVKKACRGNANFLGLTPES